MKKVLFIIAIISSTLNAQESISDKWNYGLDKQKHELIGHGFGVTGTSLMLNSNLGYGYFESVAGPIVVSAFPILLKEGYDHSFKRGGFASEQDMVWGFYGVAEGSIMTASSHALSEWMLNKRVFGSTDSYTVPAVFVGYGVPFLSELGKWGMIDGYRFNPMNMLIKGTVHAVHMLVKYNKDKKAGRLELENFKL